MAERDSSLKDWLTASSMRRIPSSKMRFFGVVPFRSEVVDDAGDGRDVVGLETRHERYVFSERLM